MIRTAIALVPLMLAATPAFAQSHGGHAPAVRSQVTPLPAGCVRRGAPTADAPRAGTPGAPTCPAGAVPERLEASPVDPHAGHDMSSMRMPQAEATATADPHAGHDMSGGTPAPVDPHAGHDMSTMPPQQEAAAVDAHAGHDMSSMGATSADPHAGHDMGGTGTAPNVPTSADTPGRPPEDPLPPAASTGPAHAADLLFDPAEMSAARRQLLAENGDVRTIAVIVDQLEASSGEGDDAYAWEIQGWSGGDIHRFWWKSEGEGAFGGKLEEVELQALYSRAISPFFDVQAGVRQTYRTEGDDRTDLVVGVQGLAPYWFEVDAAAFLSNKGELTARAEAEYDQRLTNRWILQPRAEMNFSASDSPELSIGTGLSSLQVGVRLRYEVRKAFAPYVGVEWTRSFGDTADYIQASGRSADDTRWVVGLRAWF